MLENEGDTAWETKPKDCTRTFFDKKDVVDVAKPWYELPERKSSAKKIKMVGPLSDRPYITVNNPYEEINISKLLKKENISIDDILFASRALCCGPDRSVSSYTVLYDDGITLKLMADIDNWST